jgi:molybdate transport system regulatory protein
LAGQMWSYPAAASQSASCMLSRMAESAKNSSTPAKTIGRKPGAKTGTRAGSRAETHVDSKVGAKTDAQVRNKAGAKADAQVRNKARPEVSFRMRIRKGETVALGPGKVELLEAVREHGSISAAARSLDMSYRRAWLLIDELNRSLKSPATVSEQGGQSGGGCVLTEVGESIVRLYRDVEAQAEKACATQIGDLIRLMRL